MKQKLYKPKVAKAKDSAPNRSVDRATTIRIDEQIKQRFTANLRVGRPTTITDVIEEMMNAYSDATERDGKQPEFPLEVRSKPAAKEK